MHNVPTADVWFGDGPGYLTVNVYCLNALPAPGARPVPRSWRLRWTLNNGREGNQKVDGGLRAEFRLPSIERTDLRHLRLEAEDNATGVLSVAEIDLDQRTLSSEGQASFSVAFEVPESDT